MRRVVLPVVVFILLSAGTTWQSLSNPDPERPRGRAAVDADRHGSVASHHPEPATVDSNRELAGGSTEGTTLRHEAPVPEWTRDPRAAVVVLAAGRGTPWVHFLDGREVPTELSGQESLAEPIQSRIARPKALASADFDEDGVPDLLAAYEAGAGRAGGLMVLHRGNVDAIYPYAPEAKERKAKGTFTDSPFLPDAKVVPLPVKPKFLGAGDFDADGHWDAVVAAEEEQALTWLPGDGKGGFEEPKAVALPGLVTAFVTGEINRRDGLTDVVVGVTGQGGSRLLVFEGPKGALAEEPEALPLPEPATALALGFLDEEHPVDLAVAAGNHLLMVHGRDRKLSLDVSRKSKVGPARVQRARLPFRATSLALTDFGPERPEDSALLSESGSLYRVPFALALTSAQGRAIPEKYLGQPQELDSPGATLLASHVSCLRRDDLLVADHKARRIQGIVSSQPQPMLIPVDGEPVAILPMRLNSDALNDLVVLSDAPATISVVPSMPLSVFFVTNVNDSGGGSLRKALIDANTFAGADSIKFDIPGPGPHTIQPLSVLPSITESVTVDGTTEPDFAGSPVVELDVTAVSGSGGYALEVNAPSSAVRGLVINRMPGCTGACCSASTGIRLTGGDTIIEGNFIGTDVAGISARTVAYGIIVTSSNNTIGGTVAQARNLVGATDCRGLVLSDGTTGNVVKGNLIGMNLAADTALGTLYAVDILGADALTIGGTTSGARNVIVSTYPSASVFLRTGSNGNLIQGNYLGSNGTGTARLGDGIEQIWIQAGATDNTIGGTSPAARNLIVPETMGVRTQSTGTLVQGNFIGTDVTGTIALGGIFSIGVESEGGSANTIGGSVPGARNVVSGLLDGIVIAGDSDGAGVASGNLVQNNIVGADVSGTAPLGNALGIGVTHAQDNDVIGNVIAASGFEGVWVFGDATTAFASTNNRFLGNKIGTDITGTLDLGNGAEGIEISGDAIDNVIGGSSPAERNIISGNETEGVLISGPGATGNVIAGNYIGTDATGTLDLGNRFAGVLIDGASSNTIGGGVSGEGNVISGNNSDGIQIVGGATLNRIEGNRIGTRTDGVSPLGNSSHGIFLQTGASAGNTIGGLNPSEGNVIAFNGIIGIDLFLGTGNPFLSNRVHSNGNLGVDLAGDGVTANDAMDLDGGANNLQNFPLIAGASSSLGSGTSVYGQLHSSPNADFIIDLFASDSCDISGSGEGKYFLGQTGTSTLGTGTGEFFGSFPFALSPGQVVTGTATSFPGGDTSEFSICFPGFLDRPGEVLNLNWTAGSTTSLEWSSAAGAASYALFRGSQAQLGSLTFEAIDSCFRTETSELTTGAGILTETPAIGSLHWYLVRAANGAGDGPPGNASSGPRLQDSSAVCSSSCGHNKCSVGVALAAGCEPCVTRICSFDPFCCNSSWDDRCVEEVRTICRHLGCSEGQGSCSHGLCTAGPPLVAGCDTAAPSSSCVQQVCAGDAYCCDAAGGLWDLLCIHEVDSICGKRCF